MDREEQYCPECGQRIWRLEGDLFLKCHRCGWTTGQWGIRWLTRSSWIRELATRPFYHLTLRSAVKAAVVVLLVSMLVVTAVSVGAMILVDSESPEAGIGSPVNRTQTTIGTSTSTADPPDRTTTTAPTTTRTTTTTVADADGDGLSDPRERELGTDPTDPDTDGDRLPDEWEVNDHGPDGERLYNASPTHKDLYVQFLYGSGAPQLTEEERDELKAAFAEMPVENPDGSTGIRLHIVPAAQSRVSERIVVDNEDKADEYMERWYTDDRIDGPRCGVHLVVVATEINSEFAGWGDAPGYRSIIDGSETWRNDGSISARVNIIIHELLHNIVGELPSGGSHTDEGYLYHGTSELGRNTYLSEKATSDLNNGGFASTEEYGICSN